MQMTLSRSCDNHRCRRNKQKFIQQIVSSGTFELVVVLVNVLFVTESPIDGKPCDELECCCPCVVFDVQRPVFELQSRLIAVDTCSYTKEEIKLIILSQLIYFDHCAETQSKIIIISLKML